MEPEADTSAPATGAARILDPRRPADRREVDRLRGDPLVEVDDRIGEQLGELVLARAGDASPTEEQVADAVARHVGPGPVGEHGVWVHHPWSRRLVHLLDEDEVVELRLVHRAGLGPDEATARRGLVVGVAGDAAGPVAATALELVAGGVGELRTLDPGAVTPADLGEGGLAVHHLGLPGAVAVARLVAEVDPFVATWCREAGDGATLRRFLSGLDLVLDASGGSAWSAELAAACGARRVPLVRLAPGADAVDVVRFDLEPHRPAGPPPGGAGSHGSRGLGRAVAPVAVALALRILGGEAVPSGRVHLRAAPLRVVPTPVPDVPAAVATRGRRTR
ncbi:MAG: hypothetical protein AB7L84_06665 [Acidimicrobiia bacterium]